MKLITFLFVMLAAPALAQSDVLRFISGPMEWDTTTLVPDSLYVRSIGDHCNASRGHYLYATGDILVSTALGTGDAQISTALGTIPQMQTMEFRTADMTIGSLQSVGTTSRTISPLRPEQLPTPVYSDWADPSAILPDTTQPLTIEITTAPGDPGHVVTGPASGIQYRAATGTFRTQSNVLSETVYLIDDNPKAPSIYELSRIHDDPKPKILFVFKNQKRAQLTTELVGLGLIVAGGALGGKAEYYSRYHGTTSDWDSFHITRDAGLLTTGAGCTLLGASFALDDNLSPWEVACKLGLAALLYRASAEAIYGFMD